MSPRIAWSAALILLLAAFAFKAGKEGLSNFYAQTAHMEIERWSRPGLTFKGDEGTRVVQYLNKSLLYSPNNPWPLEEMGSLQLRSMSVARDPQIAVAAASAANVAFRLALVERPTSPFTRANFILTKQYLGEQDDELFRALQRAEELGPWEPEVQRTVVFVGLAVWDRLNPAQQAVVTRAMERGAQRDAGTIAKIASDFSRIDLFCAIKHLTSQGREICDQQAKSEQKAQPVRKGHQP
ncbi:MAG: hypothetical protein IH604_06325 [Burkholderiales bacterium]|nr:hypothetical protein [Burkholderiales bacterium]